MMNNPTLNRGRTFRWKKGVIFGVAFFPMLLIWASLRGRDLTVRYCLLALGMMATAAIVVIAWESLSKKPWSWERAALTFLAVVLAVPVIVIGILSLIFPQN